MFRKILSFFSGKGQLLKKAYDLIIKFVEFENRLKGSPFYDDFVELTNEAKLILQELQK